MTALSRTELRATEAVARQFSASWERGDTSPNAYLTVAGQRIAVEIAVVPKQGRSGAKARLRDDRVARRFLQDVETAVGPRVPPGRTVILTLGAPIRLPNQTLAILTETLLSRLG